MLKDYPIYERGDLERIFSKLPAKEKQTIDDFISYCAIGAGKRKLSDIRRSIIQFRNITERNFDNLDLLILRNFLALLNKSGRKKYTSNGIKIYLKRFIKWKFKDWSEHFDNLKDIKLVPAFNEEKINEHTILTKEQIEKIMNKEKDLIKKTFFITLYESGLRPSELRGITWDKINFNVDGDISSLNIFASKTSKARVVFVKEATYWLTKLKEDSKNEYVFASAQNKKHKNEPISKQSAVLWIRETGKKAGINVYPYLLRHSRATELYKNIPSKIAQKFMGHGRDMSDLYSHFSSSDVKESMLKNVYTIEKLTPEQKENYEKRITHLEKRLSQYEGVGWKEEIIKDVLTEMQAIKLGREVWKNK